MSKYLEFRRHICGYREHLEERGGITQLIVARDKAEMKAAFCSPIHVRRDLTSSTTRLSVSRSRCRPQFVCCESRKTQPQQKVKDTIKRLAITASTIILLSANPDAIDVRHPPPADALGLAPTPINPYAKRRADKAYKEYVQRLETKFEQLPIGDLKRVVETGGGGLSISYRIAGLSAFLSATLAILVVHPIDSVKTRLQVGASDEDLFEGLYKGVLANILREAPNASIYLGVYEIIKGALMSTPLTSIFRDLPLLTFLLAGALGDAVGSIVRVPAEVVNKRLQLALSPNFLSASVDIFASSSGRASLWNAWGSVLLRDVPFGGIQIMLYELGKNLMHQHAASLPAFIPSSGLPADILIGSIAGAFTAFVTTPADVLVTRIAIASGAAEGSESESSARRLGVMEHANAVMKSQGPFGFFSGALQRGSYYLVMSALFFGLYETISQAVLHPANISNAINALQALIACPATDIQMHMYQLMGALGPDMFSILPWLLLQR